MQPKVVKADIAGRPFTIEVGKLAKQAGGSAVVRCGDTMVLVTATAQPNPRDQVDFLPLTVDYQERTFAAGKIPGGFFKREGRPTEKEVLTSRLIDRPCRPLFPENWRCETQIVATVLSAEKDNDPDMLAMCGASAALMVSDIPFAGPIAGIRVGRVDGKFVLNPTAAQLEKSDVSCIFVSHDRFFTRTVATRFLEIRKGRLVETDVPMRNAMNEVLRDWYVDDCQGGVGRWNKILEEYECGGTVIQGQRLRSFAASLKRSSVDAVWFEVLDLAVVDLAKDPPAVSASRLCRAGRRRLRAWFGC